MSRVGKNEQCPPKLTSSVLSQPMFGRKSLVGPVGPAGPAVGPVGREAPPQGGARPRSAAGQVKTRAELH